MLPAVSRAEPAPSAPAIAVAKPPERKAESDYDAADPNRSFVTYARAAANVMLVNWFTWQLAWSRDKDWAPITRDTLLTNFRDGFTFDQDTLRTNFFGHPYHGGLQFTAARGAGLTFSESALYTMGGTLFWEVFSERERPAVNDLAVTALGGILLGEITYRLSSQVLDDSQSGGGRLVRELLGTVIAPARSFDRLTTGRSFRDGPPPLQKPLRFRLDLGVDRMTLQQENEPTESPRPALLVALDVEYGKLLPEPGQRSLGAFDFFELYAGANSFEELQRGIHASADGLLYGRDFPVSAGPSGPRDNDVVGLSLNYEYVGTNVTTYSAVSFGAVNYLVLRSPDRELRLSAGIDLVPILGATTPEVRGKDRDYTFASGFSPRSGVELRHARFGDLGMRMRHYVTAVVDGPEGMELVGSTRLWYESPVWHGLGLGVSPTLIYRRGVYRHRDDYSAQQISTQAYLFYEP